MKLIELINKIETIPKIGPKRKYIFNKLGIITIKDLLLYFPEKYLNISNKLKEGEILFKAKVIRKVKCTSKLYKVYVFFSENIIELRLYNIKLYNIFFIDKFYYIYGDLYDNVIKSPKIFNNNQKNFVVYKNLPSYFISNIINEILENLEDITKIYKDKTLKKILKNIHNGIDLKESFYALKYLEAHFFIDLFKKKEKIEPIHIDVQEILSKFPYELSQSQKSIVLNIAKKLSSDEVMNYFIYGEVGSGKTLICILSALMIINAGYIAVLVVPTVSLAYQHYEEIIKVLNKEEVILYTSLTKSKEKTKQFIINHRYKFIISTHAIFYMSDIPNIGLVIIDEMHKFGVLQRANILNRALRKNLLMLTATPIPRSLGILLSKLMDYGKLPSYKERQIETFWLHNNKLNSIIDKIKDKKVYWVLPYIEDTKEIIGAKTRFEFLKKHLNNVILLHGKMKDDEKLIAIENFKNLENAVLVATIIIEIGINVPDANLIIIESAERFGLSQLHQLRGRVGRKGQKAYCILISEYQTKKIKYMKKYDNGFDISEKDLELRKVGMFTGIIQHGCDAFQFLTENDQLIIDEAQKNPKNFQEFILFNSVI